MPAVCRLLVGWLEEERGKKLGVGGGGWGKDRVVSVGSASKSCDRQEQLGLHSAALTGKKHVGDTS